MTNATLSRPAEFSPIAPQDEDTSYGPWTLPQMLVNGGMDEERAREVIADGENRERLRDGLDRHGLRITCDPRYLVKITNTRWHCGRLEDGTLHYESRVFVKGNAYRVRHVLKSAGFRFDGASKEWYMRATWAQFSDKTGGFPVLAQQMLDVLDA